MNEASTSADTRQDESALGGEDDDDCILCGEPMEPSKSCCVKERGIQNLMEASIKRNDNKYFKLRNMKVVTVHKTCQKMYPRESNIQAALKAQNDWKSNRKRSQDGRQFDFESYCFFCYNMCQLKKKCSRVVQQKTIDNIIAQLQVYENTEKNKLISARLTVLRDKDDNYYISKNVSYHAKCLSEFYQYFPHNVKGRPITENMSDLLTFIINYIIENCEECQFSLKAILNEYVKEHGDTELPRLDRIERHLKNHFEDEIVIHSSSNDRFICYKRGLGKCLEDSWYTNRKSDENEERLRIVELAAHIIIQDIRSTTFDTKNYNSPNDFLNGVNEDIPESLKLLLDIVIKTHKRTPKNGSWTKWENKVLTVAHILMSAVRPRSFTSPLLLGLSCMMHTKFSARGLIDCLHNIGLCASYAETIRFEDSVVNDPDNFGFVSDTYLQFIYDNADHNTGTIDGKNTFHCMGGIMCITPSSSVSFKSTVPRVKGVMPANTSGAFGFLPLTDFKNKKPFKLDNVIVHNWKEADDINLTINLEPIDLLHFYGKHTAPKETSSWHGFMNKYHTFNEDFCTSRVIALPFIKAPPSDHTTILTALIDARQRADKNNQRHCFVTFDLPLYMKASEIVASISPENDPHNLQSVIPRLGGFHMAMSFLGSIGNIMTGSGLKEAFTTIYAELSADKALTGHAFSRAERGHLLVQTALASIMFKKVVLTENEKAYLHETLQNVGEENFESVFDNPLMIGIKQKFFTVIDTLEQNGPTSQLWVQYFKMICLLQRFIDAERSGNFDLHLQTVKSMIPIFFASGLYAKACLLYVQQMANLKNVMDIDEYDKFCKRGFYTIRRSHRFWCGIWSDMTIEQVLMRAMKCSGGLTHGRGLNENVIMRWVLSRIAVLEVGNAVELFCNTTFTTSEQHVHVENRASRISRDADDLSKILNYFETFDPFPETDKIIGIYSGVVGDLNKVNCHKAFEIGKALMIETSNKKFTDIKFKRSSKVVHLAAANSTVKNLNNDEVYISPLLIFQKISLNIESQEDMKEYCSSYELSPIPLALFDENGMRKTTKSVFYSNFNFSHEIATSEETITYVVDGGFFLHKVVWTSNVTIENIVNNYVRYAKNHYTANSWIIFDGYPEDETLSTKSVERSRRQLKNIGREISFNKNTTIVVNQKQFLSNEKNKSKLIDMICTELNGVGFRTKIAPEDADRMIVVTAIENARVENDNIVIIVGEDVDLLVIFSQLGQNIDNIFFRKEGKGAIPHQFYNSTSFKHQALNNIVGFLHAFCGCDTTSSFYRMGKNKLIDSFEHSELIELASVFYDNSASCERIASSAFKLVTGMYSNKAEKKLIKKSSSFSLSDLRYLHFSKAKIKTKFALESLPPTEGAAKQHAFRVYYQLQLWLGHTNLKATDWGWQVKLNNLIPIGTTDPPIPRKLLEQISCSCSKKGCIDALCTCKKHGLDCTNLCAHCQDDTCYNLQSYNSPPESENECPLEDDNDDDFMMNMPAVNFDNVSDDEIDTELPAKRAKM